MTMFMWDEVIDRYEVLKKGSKGQRSKLAGCMAQILPSLRQAVEIQFPDVRLSLVMLAVELRIPGTSQAVVIQCVEECRFIVRIKNNQYIVLEENKANLADVVEQTIQYLKLIEQEEK